VLNTIYSLGPPIVTISSHNLSKVVDRNNNEHGNEALNITINWSLSSESSADSYLINIYTNASKTPYGGLLNITTASVTHHELTGFMAGYEYNITVRGVTANCGGLLGGESDPLTLIPQGNLCYVPHHVKKNFCT